MTRAERSHLIKWARGLSSEELEKEYYASIFDTLSSKAEEMYERGYDIRDILEQKKNERDLVSKSYILEKICTERGIPLWEEI